MPPNPPTPPPDPSVVSPGSSNISKPTSLLNQLVNGNGKDAAVDTDTKSDDNAFTKLFGKESGAAQPSEKGPPPLAQKNSSLAALLGPKPSFSPRAFEEKERHRAYIASVIFKLSLLLGVMVYVYFFVQLDPNAAFLSPALGQNIGQRFDNSAAEIERVQTERNITRYRVAKIWIDEANGMIDPFFRASGIVQSETATDTEKQEAQNQLQTLEVGIKEALKKVQTIFQEQLGVDTFSRTPLSPQEREARYSQLLLERLNFEKTRLLGEDAARNEVEISGYDALSRLVENSSFRSTIMDRDLDTVTDTEFSTLLKSIREQGTDTVSLIEKIKGQRLNWQQLISRIHLVTREVDESYGKGFFQATGGFLFTSYRFDAKTGRVSINGLTRLSDSKTFSQIASLVDEIEKSPYFKDIDFRSYMKNRSEDGDYSSSVNLEFSLQKEGERDARDRQLDVAPKPAATQPKP